MEMPSLVYLFSVGGQFLEFLVAAHVDTGSAVLSEVQAGRGTVHSRAARRGWGQQLPHPPASLNKRTLGNNDLARSLVHFVISSKACIIF